MLFSLNLSCIGCHLEEEETGLMYYHINTMPNQHRAIQVCHHQYVVRPLHCECVYRWNTKVMLMLNCSYLQLDRHIFGPGSGGPPL